MRRPREKKARLVSALVERGSTQAEQGVAVLHFLKMRREAQRGKEEREGGAKDYSMRARASVSRVFKSKRERPLARIFEGNGPAMDTGVRTGQGRGGQPRLES